MVRIRMKRFGRTHAPTYRLCAMDKRSPRNGRAIEELGYYHPCNKNEDEQVKLNEERIKYWLSVGAQPSKTAANLMKKHGIDPTPGKKA
ncbi:30S ribosomal protein S16 [Phycisphaeraceae bacterium D3-23]